MEAAKPIDINTIPKNIQIKAKTDKGNNILIRFKNENNELNILIYLTEFSSQFVYEKSFSLKSIQENEYFKNNYTINDIIEEILLINQHRTINYIEKPKNITIIIPLSFKSKGNEIIFEVEQRIKTMDDKINELYELINYNSNDRKLDNIENILNEINEKFIIQLEEKNKRINELENELREKNKIIEENNKILLKYKSSQIINEKEFQIISDWINPNINFEFNLLFNSERDGDSLSTLHKLIDGKGPTLLIIKSNSNYIFGAFTQDNWNLSGNWLNNPNNFLFSITNKKKYPKNNSDNYGISGKGIDCLDIGGGHDIKIKNNFCNTQENYTNLVSYIPINGMQNQYELNGGIQKFKIITLEIYSVKKID